MIKNPCIILELNKKSEADAFTITYKDLDCKEAFNLLANGVLSFIDSSTQGGFENMRNDLKQAFVKIILGTDNSTKED